MITRVEGSGLLQEHAEDGAGIVYAEVVLRIDGLDLELLQRYGRGAFGQHPSAGDLSIGEKLAAAACGADNLYAGSEPLDERALFFGPFDEPEDEMDALAFEDDEDWLTSSARYSAIVQPTDQLLEGEEPDLVAAAEIEYEHLLDDGYSEDEAYAMAHRD